MREISELQKSPPEGIRIQTSDDNMLDVVGIIQGPGAQSCLVSDASDKTRLYCLEMSDRNVPEGTPYSGGYFKIKFKFTEEFPQAPPKCTYCIMFESDTR
jgi:ubiquitin-conjugating enzyme E2 S